MVKPIKSGRIAGIRNSRRLISIQPGAIVLPDVANAAFRRNYEN
jgi:hypothetical protein